VASHVLHGHSDEIHWVEPFPPAAAGAKPSGDFVTGGYDGRVIVWRAPDFHPELVFKTAHGRVHIARPSPDGALLAIGADDGGLHIVTRAGKPVAAPVGHVGDVQHMAWSPDGKQLVTSDDHGNVWLWPRAGQGGRQLTSSAQSVGALAFSADGTVIVAGNHAGQLWRWPADGSSVLTVQLPTDVTDVWADHARVIAVDAAGVVRTWRAADQLVLERSVETGQPTKRVVFAAGGGWLVLGGVSGTAVLVEGDHVEPIARHRKQVRYLAISDDGARVATASDDGVLQVVDRKTARHITLLGHSARVRHIAFAGDVLLSVDGEGVVRRWELGALPASVLETNGAPVDHVAVTADGDAVAATDGEGNVWRWRLRDGGRTSIGKLDGHASAIALVGGASDPPTVVTGTAEGKVTWWREPAGDPVSRDVGGIVHQLAVGPDVVAAATSLGAIAVFDLAGTPAGMLAGNTHGTEALAFDPTGKLLAAGGQDRVIRVYRRGEPFADRRFDEVAQLDGPGGDTHFVMWTPSGDRLITAGNDGVAYSWRVVDGAVDGKSRVVLGKHTGAISGLAVSPDGRWFASGARDDLVIRQPLGPASAAQAFAAGDALPTGGAASVIAFDAAGGIQAVTRTGAVVHATAAGVGIAVDHGAIGGALVGKDRLAVALDDGAIVIEQLGPHSLDELARVVGRATTYRLPPIGAPAEAKPPKMKSQKPGAPAKPDAAKPDAGDADAQ
jgi:WD40 repeat protein